MEQPRLKTCQQAPREDTVESSNGDTIELGHAFVPVSSIGPSLGSGQLSRSPALLQSTLGTMAQQKRLWYFIVIGSATSLLVLYHLKYTAPFAPASPILPTFSSDQKDGSLAGMDWSRFAYVQYVTTLPYLCNSVMLFERLHKLGSKADRLLLYPHELSPDAEGGEGGALLRKARDAYSAILKPIEVQRKDSADCKSDVELSTLTFRSITC